jgi:hypothetical protein
MALPKLNESPKYDLVIPSTGKKVRFRPYLIKEEKVLLMAFESKDIPMALKSVVDTMTACITEEIDPKSLTLFDVEYMFTKIRAKSVGEIADLMIGCSSCKEQTPVQVNIDDVDIVIPDVSNKIDLGDGITVEVEWPNYLTTVNNPEILDESSEAKQMIEIAIAAIRYVNTADEKIDVRDEPKETVRDFVESMNNEQFAKIREYLEKMPRMRKEVEFDCVHCRHHNKVLVENLSDFF